MFLMKSENNSEISNSIHYRSRVVHSLRQPFPDCHSHCRIILATPLWISFELQGSKRVFSPFLSLCFLHVRRVHTHDEQAEHQAADSGFQGVNPTVKWRYI
jgi:hypothetical protein